MASGKVKDDDKIGAVLVPLSHMNYDWRSGVRMRHWYACLGAHHGSQPVMCLI